MLERNKLYCGDVRELSDQLDENSLNTIITSPPYWALRFYDIPPSIWDADTNCEHEWYKYTVKVEMYNNEKRIHWQNKGASRKTTPEAWDKTLLEHKICKKCGAWVGWLGLEPDFNLYITHLCDVFDKLKRPLRDDGTLWVNLGDTHYTKSGSGFHFDKVVGKQPEGKSNIHIANQIRGLGLLPSKCLVLAPQRFVVEMVNRGWICRNVLIWQKNNVIPNSAKDRFTVDFEYLFLFTLNKKYYFEKQLEPYATPPKQRYRPNPYPDKAINKDGKSTGGQGIHDGKRTREDFFKNIGRNKRTVWEFPEMIIDVYYNPEVKLDKNESSVWNINTKPCKEAHFAVFPPELVKIPIEAGCPEFVCTKCGKPREKIINKNPINVRKHQLHKGKARDAADGKNPDYQVTGFARTGVQFEYEYEHIGYTDCGCGVEFKSGVVCDPFAGTNTTGRVARSLKRDWIGFDASEEYIKIADKLMEKEILWEKEDSGDDLGDMMLI